jgi:hypothetical protein
MRWASRGDLEPRHRARDSPLGGSGSVSVETHQPNARCRGRRCLRSGRLQAPRAAVRRARSGGEQSAVLMPRVQTSRRLLVVVVAAVSDQRSVAAAWPADAASNGRHAVEQLEQLGDVVAVAAVEHRASGTPLLSTSRWCLLPRRPQPCTSSASPKSAIDGALAGKALHTGRFGRFAKVSIRAPRCARSAPWSCRP